MKHTKRIAGLAIAAATIAAACTGGASTGPSGAPSAGASGAPSGSPAAALKGNINIDGSSTVYPITAAIAEDFGKENKDVKVAVGYAGTGGGFKKFCAGETDMNDASRPIKKDDEGEGAACTKNGIPFVELKVAIDGLSVVVNRENTWATCLTVDELKRIYGPDSPADLKWSDVRAGFPADPVKRYMPGADSGTFDYFTEAINGKLDAATQNATQSEDDNVLVTGVKGDKNAIGFFGFAYYVENQDAITAVGVDAGKGCIAPTAATINDGTYAPLSRPLFLYPNTKLAKERPELAAFVDYYLANTNAISKEIGYVDLPADQLQASKDAWAAAIK